MKNLRPLGGAIVLIFLLSFSTFAGDIDLPGVSGQMEFPVTAVALAILQNALSVL